MPVAAVITGDIVNSTQLVPQREKKLIAQLGRILEIHKFEFYRGDSFQVYVRNPLDALALLFQLRATARSFAPIHDVRASIGIGKTNVPVRELRTVTSEAFVMSGRAFDQLQKEQRMVILSANAEANIAFRVVASYGDFIFKRLTSKQGEVLLELLRQNTQAATATKLKKSQGTVNKHAQAAGWTEIQGLINEYKQVITQFRII